MAGTALVAWAAWAVEQPGVGSLGATMGRHRPVFSLAAALAIATALASSMPAHPAEPARNKARNAIKKQQEPAKRAIEKKITSIRSAPIRPIRPVTSKAIRTGPVQRSGPNGTTSTRNHKWLAHMTIEDVRRPGATRRPMPSRPACGRTTHRTSAASCGPHASSMTPASILDRPQGRGPRSPEASDASSVAEATAFGALLPDQLVLRDQVYQPFVIPGTRLARTEDRYRPS